MRACVRACVCVRVCGGCGGGGGVCDVCECMRGSVCNYLIIILSFLPIACN